MSKIVVYKGCDSFDRCVVDFVGIDEVKEWEEGEDRGDLLKWWDKVRKDIENESEDFWDVYFLGVDEINDWFDEKEREGIIEKWSKR